MFAFGAEFRNKVGKNVRGEAYQILRLDYLELEKLELVMVFACFEVRFWLYSSISWLIGGRVRALGLFRIRTGR